MSESSHVYRRQFLKRGAVTALGATAILANSSCGQGQEKPEAGNQPESGGEAEFLFVQTCRSATLAEGKLTLFGVAPTTLYFSDRPDRITGHLETKDFVEDWGEGEDSFASNNPNAALSIINDDYPEEVVLVLKSPTLADGNLVYDVDVLEGPESASGEAASLFIDTVRRARHRRRRRHRARRRHR
jgi:hypothetical protein